MSVSDEKLSSAADPRRGKKSRGLRFIIVSNMATVMLTAIILTFLIVFRITSLNITRVEVRRAQDTMRSLQVSVSRLFSEKRSISPSAELELKIILEQLVRGLELESVVVVDGLGKVVLRLPPEGPITLGGGEPDLRRAMGGLEMVTTERRRGFGFFSSGIEELSVSVPVIVGGKLRGGIKARFSMRTLDRNIRITQSILIGFIIASMALTIFFGGYLLSKTVVRPIYDLIDATKDFASGNLERRVSIKGENEFSVLAESFNEMAEGISTNRRELEDNLRALRQVNKALERTRAELVYSEKLATVGRLAQGVAHEIGNPLSAVLGYLELMRRMPNLPEKSRDYVERIEREIARVNVIIRELLDYSRPSPPELKPVDVDEIISALMTLLTGQKRFHGITFDRRTDRDIPLIVADRNQLLQVLVNLAFNAADAMPDGGTLKIGASKGEWTPPETENSFMAGDLSEDIELGTSVVCIRIEDTGAGIEEEDLSRIFDPFFTSKEPGQGTGLGLAICARIVENFGARIGVKSEPGKGSVFTIYFPIRKPK